MVPTRSSLAGSFPTNPTWLNDREILYNRDDADALWKATPLGPGYAQEPLGGPKYGGGAFCTLADPSADAGGRFVALHSSVSSCAAHACACPWIEVQDYEVPVKGAEPTTKRLVPLKLALFATDEARKIDVPGYFRVDAQPQRAFSARPSLDSGSAFSNAVASTPR